MNPKHSLRVPAFNFLLLLSVIVFAGCGGNSSKPFPRNGDLYSPRYASGFSIGSLGESSVLTIENPWQNASGVVREVFLSRNGELPPADFDGTVLGVPLKKVVAMSSSYVAFMDALGESQAVCGVSGGRYIYNDSVRVRFLRGDIREVGYDANLNFELIASLAPDVVLMYGISDANTSVTRKFDELGIKYLYIGEYVENSPLGKAEWLVAFGEMFDRREEAETIFRSIEERYTDLCKRVEDETAGRDRPVVMLNAPWRDSWFVPGDRSYIVSLIEDAGGDYACKGVDSDESRPISTETAFVSAGKSDVWLNPGQVENMGELKSLNPRFSSIPPVKSGRVFNANLRKTPDGGSDFWESGAVRPDIVLTDMVRILYPDIVSGHELYYFRKIE